MTAGSEIDLHAPIPRPQRPQDGWKEVPIVETDDPMVPIGPFSDYPDLHTNSVYYGERLDSPYQDHTGNRLDGSCITMFVRRSVAERVRRAQRRLRPRHHFVVYNAYRSVGEQQALYDQYLSSLRLASPTLSEEALSVATQKMVSLPSVDPKRPSPHNTGGSVDLAAVELDPDDDDHVCEIDAELAQLEYESDWAQFERTAVGPGRYAEPTRDAKRAYQLEMERMLILRTRGNMLDFGTPFDHGGPEAALRHFETVPERSGLIQRLPRYRRDAERRDNRRELYAAMTGADLTDTDAAETARQNMVAYEPEWWHYNAPETQMGAHVLGLSTAGFGAQLLGSAHRNFENMRRSHHARMIWEFTRLTGGQEYLLSGHVPSQSWVNELNREVLEKMYAYGAHPRTTRLPAAAVITAPQRRGARLLPTTNPLGRR